MSDLDVFKKLFFIFPVTVQEIDQKIKMNNYRSIDELKQDLLNIQHCIAILYGGKYIRIIYLLFNSFNGDPLL